jgi:hypothetical protein
MFIWAWFREWKGSAPAIAGAVHDVVIRVGAYAPRTSRSGRASAGHHGNAGPACQRPKTLSNCTHGAPPAPRSGRRPNTNSPVAAPMRSTPVGLGTRLTIPLRRRRRNPQGGVRRSVTAGRSAWDAGRRLAMGRPDFAGGEVLICWPPRACCLIRARQLPRCRAEPGVPERISEDATDRIC